jgi:CubicO group peptidase (beta-lactamase class C family)
LDFETTIHHLIEKGIIPGISLLVGRGEEIVLKKHYGYKALKPVKEILQENTIYDTASLTKPLISALSTLYLSERKEIDLHAGIKKYFPELPFEFEIYRLLCHTSGLPAWFPFYLYGKNYFSTFKKIRLEAKPGKKVNYSCVGYILLYYLIEKVTGTGFKDFARQLIIDPLNLTNTYLKVPAREIPNTAPTEEGNRFEKKMAQKEHGRWAGPFMWRETMIRGETHDANAHYLGGTAGNAGLFSTAEDLFRLSFEFYPASATLLRPDTLSLFWKNFTPLKKSHRSYGFKLNSSFITSGGNAISRKAIGHSGFTGTSIWLEPGSGYKYILLTNRVHPEVTNLNFNRIRRKLHHLLKKQVAPGK